MIRRKWSAREIALGSAVLAIILALLTFYIWYQTEAIRLGKDIERDRDEIATLREEIKKLEIRRAELLDPAVVDRIARNRLGLREASPDEVFHQDSLAAAKAPNR